MAVLPNHFRVRADPTKNHNAVWLRSMGLSSPRFIRRTTAQPRWNREKKTTGGVCARARARLRVRRRTYARAYAHTNARTHAHARTRKHAHTHTLATHTTSTAPLRTLSAHWHQALYWTRMSATKKRVICAQLLRSRSAVKRSDGGASTSRTGYSVLFFWNAAGQTPMRRQALATLIGRKQMLCFVLGPRASRTNRQRLCAVIICVTFGSAIQDEDNHTAAPRHDTHSRNAISNTNRPRNGKFDTSHAAGFVSIIISHLLAGLVIFGSRHPNPRVVRRCIERLEFVSEVNYSTPQTPREDNSRGTDELSIDSSSRLPTTLTAESYLK